MSNEIRMIVGLGNPGRQYQGTRHNVGFDILNLLAQERGWKWEKDKKAKALIAREGSALILLKPLTFMNLSGEAVQKIARFFKIEPEEILVIYDDIALPLGRLRFRMKGSAGGHNGVKSIIQCLGGDQFPRLKFGIGAAEGEGQLVGHVLGKFKKEEKNDLEKNMARAVEGVNWALSRGIDSAMNEINQREKKPNPKRKEKENPENQPAEETDLKPDSESSPPAV